MSHSRATVALHPHQRVRVTCTANGGGGGLCGWCHSDRRGSFSVAYCLAGDVYLRWSDTGTPPYAHTGRVTTSGDASEPRHVTWSDGRIILLYTKGASDTYETVSWDAGLTWTGGTVAFAGGKHPTLSVGRDGGILRAAYVAGTLQATFQEAGQASPSAAYTLKDSAGANLAVADDSFHLVPAWEEANRWLLVVRIDGEGDVSSWHSSDNGATWARFT